MDFLSSYPSLAQAWHALRLRTAFVQAATKTLPPKPEPAALYRPRKPQLSDLYQLLETHFDDVKAQWEDRFEKAYGYWRGFVDNVVLRYFDCGVPEGGFARIVCEDCRSEPSVMRQILDHLQNRHNKDPPIPSDSLPRN